MAHYSRYRDRRIIQSGLSPAQREAGRLCAPAQSAFPPSMAVRSKRPTGVRGKTPQRGHRAGPQPKKPTREAATTQNTTPSSPKKNDYRSSRLISYQAAGTTTQSVVASLSVPYRHSAHRRHTTAERAATAAHWATWSTHTAHTAHGTHHFAHATFGGDFFHHFLHL